MWTVLQGCNTQIPAFEACPDLCGGDRENWDSSLALGVELVWIRLYVTSTNCHILVSSPPLPPPFLVRNIPVDPFKCLIFSPLYLFFQPFFPNFLSVC